ncbi:MAG TPA: hypothetical protein VMX36_07760 [Sedimentisphaerales bacterium]|nr:hypothetical protein [Sedimentisphaerales bacterium]
MAIYYLVADYLVPVYIEHEGTISVTNRSPAERREYYRERGLSLPQNYTIARLAPRTSVSVVFFDIDNGLFLIKATNQPTAYRVLRALDGFFFLTIGETPRPDRSLHKLSELRRVPNANWTRERLVQELRERNFEISPTDVFDLYSGRVVQQHEMRLLAPAIEAIYPNERLLEALCHLGHSRFLFYGFMVGSYYHCHYKHDRRAMSYHLMQKKYLENRERYELSFVSAFKGIERLLNVNQKKKHEIDQKLRRLEIADILPETKYQRWHETFLGYPKNVTYSALIKHFLCIRNAVAAHSNPSPPKRFLISEDSLIEIQLFLAELCSKVLGEIRPRDLPRGVIQPFSRRDL